MSKKVFVGGLSWNTTTDTLRQVAEVFGEIEDLIIITDRETGRSRGFGFVTFTESEAAEKCIAELDGSQLDGRTLKVDTAQERRPREGGGGGGYGGGGGGGYRGGGGGDYGGGGGGYGGGGGGYGGGGGGGGRRGGGRDRKGRRDKRDNTW